MKYLTFGSSLLCMGKSYAEKSAQRGMEIRYGFLPIYRDGNDRGERE